MKANQQSPSISGDMVVWQDWRNQATSGLDIYGYDLTTGKEFPVVVKPGPDSAPRISGQWVVYLEPTTQGKDLADLHAHSLKTGEDFPIGIIPAPNNASNGTYHAIDGDKVAWMKVTDATWGQYSSELHLYDLTSRTDRKLTDPLPERLALDVSLSAQSEIVVFNSPGGRWTVLDWHPSTPVVIPVTVPQKSVSYSLLVSGDYLVWRIGLNREGTDVNIYAVPITR
jgi:beta propeller repeat protein